MFGIGVPELILILIIGLVVFGPGRLPEVGRAIGKSLDEFKKATSGIADHEAGHRSPEEKKNEALRTDGNAEDAGRPEKKIN